MRVRGFVTRALPNTLHQELGAEVYTVYDYSVSEARERALPKATKKGMSSPCVLTLEYHLSAYRKQNCIRRCSVTYSAVDGGADIQDIKPYC
jgi:hypothetical protein